MILSLKGKKIIFISKVSYRKHLFLHFKHNINNSFDFEMNEIEIDISFELCKKNIVKSKLQLNYNSYRYMNQIILCDKKHYTE